MSNQPENPIPAGTEESVERSLSGMGMEESSPSEDPSAMPMSVFEAKRQRRIERLRERAERKRKKGEQSLARAQGIASFIPPGQPILIGHHSERRHRRDLDRIHGLTRKGLDALGEADRLEQRAISAKENGAIFSDDPAAGEKLEDKIARLEIRQKLMREANRLLRAKKSLSSLGFSEASEEILKTPDFIGRVGFPDYKLKNNGANIRRLKARLDSLRKEEERPVPDEIESNGIRLVENANENRVQLFFPGKPADAVREKLRGDGFRWSPYNGCWQRHRSAYATQLAKRYLEQPGEPSAGSD